MHNDAGALVITSEEDDERERQHEVGLRIRQVIRDQTISDQDKINWCYQTIEERDHLVSLAEERALNLEYQNTELRKTLSELSNAHDQQLADASHHHSRMEQLRDELAQARAHSRQNEAHIASAEEANSELREMAEKQGQFLESRRNEERHLRKMVQLQNATIEELQRSLDRAAFDVLQHRHRFTQLERDGGEWYSNVSSYLNALREENDYLREQMARAFGSGITAEDYLSGRVLGRGGESMGRWSLPSAARKLIRGPEVDMQDASETPDPAGPEVAMTNSDQPGTDASQTGINTDSSGSSSRSASPDKASRVNETPFTGWREGGGILSGSWFRRGSPSTQGKRSMGDSGEHIRRSKRHQIFSSNSYPSRNYPLNPKEDEEMPTLMRGLKVDADSYPIHEAQFEANTSTEVRPISQFLPRTEKSYPGPVYLQQKHSSTPLKSRLKRAWEGPPRKWSSITVPEDSSNGRTEGDTEFTEADTLETDEIMDPEMMSNVPSDTASSTEYPETESGAQAMTKETQSIPFNPWKHWFCLLVIAWLLLSTRGSSSQKSTWGGVGESGWTKRQEKPVEPEELYALLQSMDAQDVRKMTVMYYEMARWTDIDANALG